MVGLSEVKNKKVGKFSLGMKQRMGIGISFLMFLLSITASLSSLNYKDNTQANMLEIPLYGLDAFYSSMRDMPVIVFLGILVVSIIFCSEFENGFIQIEVALGYKRFQIILSKFISVFMAYSLVFFPYPIGRLVFQGLFNGFGSDFNVFVLCNIVIVFLVIVLIGFAINSITILLSLIIKKSIFVTGTSFVILILGGNALLSVAHVNENVSNILNKTPLAFFKVLALNQYKFDVLFFTGIISLFVVLTTLVIAINLFKKMDIR